MKRLLPPLALALAVGQLLLMLLSWLLSAAFPSEHLHSLLSGEGLRWLFGHFADLLATPVLAWLVLLSMAYGSVRQSGLLRGGNSYRERRARHMTLLLLLVYLAALLLLTVVPHAVLRSATGSLWPSPFSASLVPVAAFCAVTLSAFYGMVTGRFRTVSDFYEVLLQGLRAGAPLLLFYVLVAQLVASLRFAIQG